MTGEVNTTNDTSCLVLLSGGLDSTVALAMATRRFSRVAALVFDYGQACRIELERARAIAERLGAEVIQADLDLRAWGGSSLFDDEAPSDVERSEYVPARNLIFLSLAAGVAEARDFDCVWIGTNASEQSFADNSQAFRDAVQATFDLGLRRSHNGRRLYVRAPLSAIAKEAVVQAGVSYDAPMHLSWSCYGNGPEPCRICMACRQRQQAFAAAGVPDPADAARRSPRTHNDPTQFVYLLSVLGSGSTLLSLMLGAHRDITAAGELLDLRNDIEYSILCSCGLPVPLCGFWAAVLEGHTAYDRSCLRAIEDLPGDSAAYCDEATTILQSIAAHTGSRVVLDSSKHPARFEALRTSTPIKALHLVRDGRAYIAAARRRAGEHVDAAQAAEHWVEQNRRMIHIGNDPEVDYLRVRYEDLCERPEAEVARITDWLGLEAHHELASWSGAERHHLRGSRVRFGAGPVANDQRWREELSAEDLATFDVIAGELCDSLGYDSTSALPDNPYFCFHKKEPTK